MPLHDYWCAICGQLETNVYRSAHEGARANPPLHCSEPMRWIPQTTAMDAGGVKTAGFRAFDTTDGRGEPVHIDSLRKLRQVERESEVHARNGEGQPMIFRRWSQSDSNQDQPTLSKNYQGGEQPTPEAARRFGGAMRKVLNEPAYGPGVTDANTSALPVK